MRRLIAAITLAATVLVLMPSAPADAADPAAEAQFVSLLNSYRGAHGRAPLGVHGQLVAKAEAWAQHMASTGCLCHSNLPAGISGGWSKLGENVGYGANVAQVHQALVNSAPHRANMLDPAFNWVGVGVAYSGSTLWVAQVFMQGGAAPAPPRPVSPIGSLDSATRSGSQVRVTGWTLDPETKGSIRIHVYVGSRGVANVIANRPRSDVARLFAKYGPNHGFDLTVPASGGPPVCVYAINLGSGSNRLLGCRNFPASPSGHIDGAARVPGGAHLRGWAVDPDTTGPVQIHIYANGRGAASAPASNFRSDVAAAMSGYGGNHGFDITTGNARHGLVCAYAINVGPGTNRRLGCAMMNGNPRGALDSATRVPGGTRVTGWSLDPDTTAAIRVHVYANGRPVGAYTANQNRPSIGARYGAYGSGHGFSVTVPVGSGRVCVYGINTSSGSGNPLLGCRTLDASPVGSFDRVSRAGSGTRFQGWALDPDTTAPIRVHVYANGHPYTAFTANRTRSDIGSRFPYNGSAHGFDTTLRGVPHGVVCLYAINVSHGSTRNLGCRRV